MSKLAKLLAEATWTRGLTPEQRARVERDTFTRFVPKGAYIFHQGDRVDYWLGVIDGLCKMTKTGADGRVTTFVGIASGAWAGEGSLIRGRSRQYDGVTLRDSELAFLPRETFMLLLDSNLAFNRFIISQLNERLAQFIELAEFDRLREPDARVAHALASLFNPVLSPGTESVLEISQEEVANLAGLSRQRVNQALSLLQERGLLRIGHVGIKILDVEGLLRFEL